VTVRRMLRCFAALFLGAGALLAAGGCGVYTANSGRVDESIKRVYVEYLENQTAEPDLGVDLSDAIISALQLDNTLKIVQEEEADSVISGRVVRYTLREVAAREDLTVNEYQVQIAAVLTFTVRDTGETRFKDQRFTGTGNYVLDDPQGTSETTAREEAGREIVRDILALVVEDW
jgi:hypothetical protein